MTGARSGVVVRRAVSPPLRAVLVMATVLGLVGAGVVWLGGRSDAAGLRLEVWDHETQQAVHTRPVSAGERFELRHTHSVTRRPVREIFSVAPDGVAMEELWFDEFGPNLPAGAEQIGEVTTTFLAEGGGYRVLHHGRLLPTVPLRVGSAGVDHRVIFADGAQLRLLDVARPGAFVELRIRG